MDSKLRALIVGAGTTGFATGQSLLQRCVDVWFHDTDASTKRSLEARGCQVLDAATNRPENFDIIYISVPTPTEPSGMSEKYLVQALETTSQLVSASSSYTVVTVRSTILPGTMDGLIVPHLKAGARGHQLGICYQPSFARSATAELDEAHPRVIVAACEGVETTAVMMRVFRRFDSPLVLVSFKEAELIKYGANLFNALKISYFNLLHLYSESLGASPDIVTDGSARAAVGNWDPSYGTKGGLPFDGKCLPKDLEAFILFLRTAEIGHGGLLEEVQRINAVVRRDRRSPNHQIAKSPDREIAKSPDRRIAK